MTEQEKWNAVISSDTRVDGIFYYAVRTTGIFCRPSCKSKPPARKNILYFDTREDASAAGFRPCKRCRPDLTNYQPHVALAERAKSLILTHYADGALLIRELPKLGASRHRIDQIFREQYGVTPAQYRNRIRVRMAGEMLRQSALPIDEIAFSLGFESPSAFFAFFRKHTGSAPREYRYGGSSPDGRDVVYGVYDTTFGQMTISCGASAIQGCRFGYQVPDGCQAGGSELSDRTARQLEEYFAGRRTLFDLPLEPAGTQFQKSVWQALCRIPYGKTRTYGQIAQEVGNPNASRAVGSANHNNPIHVIIPCHRVIGAGGALTGYAGGLEMKEKLLRLEQSSKNEKPRTEENV